jgi:carboxymethylenebutenolidase
LITDTVRFVPVHNINEKENTHMKSRTSTIDETRSSAAKPSELLELSELFDGHIAREFADHDVDATMETMVPEPHVHCVPIMTGGVGGKGVREFYSEHFINQIPKDAKVTPISRTVGKDQVVDEIIVSFTHDTQWDYLLPGIPPTGRRVELPHVVVMKFENGKVAHEHVWWDQASLLVQVGLLDPANLPVAGVEQARKLLRVAQGSSSRR